MATTRIVIGEHVYIGVPEGNQQPIDLADMFADMDHDQQIAFFNQVARRVSEWKGPASMQWLAVADGLSSDAKRLIADWYDHC